MLALGMISGAAYAKDDSSLFANNAVVIFAQATSGEFKGRSIPPVTPAAPDDPELYKKPSSLGRTSVDPDGSTSNPMQKQDKKDVDSANSSLQPESPSKH
jgi:hypothetical protein